MLTGKNLPFFLVNLHLQKQQIPINKKNKKVSGVSKYYKLTTTNEKCRVFFCLMQCFNEFSFG